MQNAQQQLAREFQLVDENYRGMLTDAEKKYAALMQIASGHQGEELGAVAWERAKDMAQLTNSLKKDYTRWYDENIEPAWWEHMLGATGEGAGRGIAAYGSGALFEAGKAAVL